MSSLRSRRGGCYKEHVQPIPQISENIGFHVPEPSGKQPENGSDDLFRVDHFHRKITFKLINNRSILKDGFLGTKDLRRKLAKLFFNLLCINGKALSDIIDGNFNSFYFFRDLR